ncbi:MAG: TonB-dependent receptor [Ignavibacteriales bacterium]|nr:TonB-dependent receptor [Ignavibacteriales bacterium]
MKPTRNSIVLCMFFLFQLFATPLFAEDSGKITGKVIDVTAREAMVAANILIEGTSLGCSTDLDGNFLIQAIPPGTYKVKASYIGYTPVVKSEVQVISGQTTTINFELVAVGVTTDAVVVTAQAQGQNQAINQQLAADRIMNVVSSARIQELPDANAAESIARLPGVSIERDGGEGNKVVIRGLQPKYNNITIDGVRMASSNNNDRSADLSMISPNMLEGIEVSKTVTADQDADVLGGSVNFKMREAKGEKEGLGVEFLGQGGYSNLSDAYNKYRNYKFVGDVEGRFFNQKLGVFLQADVERRNLTSNELTGTYTNQGKSQVSYLIQSVNINYIPRDRQRVNGTLVMDYKLPEGKIIFSNFLSSGITETNNYQEMFIVNSSSTNQNQHAYQFNYSKSTLNSITNALNIEQQLYVFHTNLKVSNSYSETKDPGDWYVNFYQSKAWGSSNPYIADTNLNPYSIATTVSTKQDSAFLNYMAATNSNSMERQQTVALDLDFPLNISNSITSTIKFGGKYKYQTRSYGQEQYGTNANFNSSSASGAVKAILRNFPEIGITNPSALTYTNIPMTTFIDQNLNFGTFLNGDYTMSNPLSQSRLSQLLQLAHDSVGNTSTWAEAYARNNFQSLSYNYNGNEVFTAFYLMATINLGTQITLIPGVRYQDIKYTYTGIQGIETPVFYQIYQGYDTTYSSDHPYWLPDVNIRFKPFSWFDIRLAYSNTVSYPDYNALIPRIDVASGYISFNNFYLVPARSTNYDVYLSVSDNTIGLFTVGSFLKKIDNFIYAKTFNVTGAPAIAYYPLRFSNRNPGNSTYTISTYVNNPNMATVFGLEFDWQTHFWYLPNPLKGLVFNINYTHVYSKLEYPYVIPERRVTVGRVTTIVPAIDTSYIDRLIGQPNDIVNLSIGYDYKGFSIRVSMLYQADIFQVSNSWAQLRATTAAYKRWDLSAKQELPWFGLQLYCNVNNINGARDFSVLQMYSDIPTSAQSYDMTAEVGLRWQL